MDNPTIIFHEKNTQISEIAIISITEVRRLYEYEWVYLKLSKKAADVVEKNRIKKKIESPKNAFELKVI